jgi:hypothetical protein
VEEVMAAAVMVMVTMIMRIPLVAVAIRVKQIVRMAVDEYRLGMTRLELALG